MNLGRYINMLKSAEFKDDLDIVSTVHTPKGQQPHRLLTGSQRRHYDILEIDNLI